MTINKLNTLSQHLFSAAIVPVMPVVFLACLGIQTALAETIYKWVDKEGNVNFSDVAPDESVAVDTREISVDVTEVNPEDVERFSIINQAERMAEWRRQLKQERLAEKRLYLEEKRLAQEQDFRRHDELVAAEDYRLRNYNYAPTPLFLGNRGHRNRHRFDGYSPQVQQPIIPPSRRNIIPRKYGPVHL